MNKTTERATMPKGTNAVLDRRTIYNANKNLLDLVSAGQKVLDVGCGSGTITKGISELVKAEGLVIGIDPSEHLIGLARDKFSAISNLRFEVTDIHTYTPDEQFDLITSSRTLQWLANPQAVLEKMITLLKEGGCITILDYNHEKIEWSPAAPHSMQLFYESFLKWRKDADMDNTIADNLSAMFEKAGLEKITTTDQSEYIQTDSKDFVEEMGIWTKVAETRGKQLVDDQYITEELRLKAIEEYNYWIQKEAISMKMYQLSVTGYKKRTT